MHRNGRHGMSYFKGGTNRSLMSMKRGSQVEIANKDLMARNELRDKICEIRVKNNIYGGSSKENKT